MSNNIGWRPAPNGAPELWYWDGRQWIDPVENVAEQISELIVPYLERVWAEGFEAGLKVERVVRPQVKLPEHNGHRRASHVLNKYLSLTLEHDWTPA